MKHTSLPPELQNLIAQQIDSVHTLEVLLFLYGQRERAWTADDVNAHVKSSPSAARRCLNNLVQRGAVAQRGDAKFQYSPSSAKLDVAVSLLEQEYRNRSASVIRTIHGRPARA